MSAFFVGERMEVEGRQRRMRQTWCVLFYRVDGVADSLMVVRTRRPTKLAKALMCEAYTHFTIRKVSE
jgi:hypothetical protein